MIVGATTIAVLLLALAVVVGFDDVFGVYCDSGGTAISVREEVTGTARAQLETTLAGAVTNQQEDVAFTVAAIKGILITVSGNATATVVLKTNSTGSPDNTLTFPIGGGEMVWSNRSPATCPITAAVTTTYWTHAGSETVTIKLRALYNS